jgi:hypothetical protein
MSILHIFLFSVIIVLFALLGLSIRLLVSKRGEFRGGSCTNITPELKDKGISCACGDEDNCEYETEAGRSGA